MAFPVNDIIDAIRALDQIAIDAQAAGANVDRGVHQITAAAATLQGMQAEWATAVQQIRALAAANPTIPKWQRLDSDLDLIIQAFTAKKNIAIAKRDAAQAAG